MAPDHRHRGNKTWLPPGPNEREDAWEPTPIFRVRKPSRRQVIARWLDALTLVIVVGTIVTVVVYLVGVLSGCGPITLRHEVTIRFEQPEWLPGTTPTTQPFFEIGEINDEVARREKDLPGQPATQPARGGIHFGPLE